VAGQRVVDSKGFDVDILTGSDPKIVLAFWSGVAVAAITCIMLAVIIVMRQVVLRCERIHANAVAFWRAIIIATPADGVGKIPPLPDRDITGFLEVWNDVHEPLRGGTTAHLTRIAREVGLEERLYNRLSHGRFHTRLVAIIAMGHVQNAESFRRIEKFMDDTNPIVSLCVARALMQIDPDKAISMFVPRIASRSDWSQGSIATILNEAGADRVTRELSEATLQANVDMAPRLIRFLASVSPESAGPIIRNILLTSPDGGLISTCLQVMSNPEDLDCVRPLLVHPRWHVRMQAAVTLGRLGVPGDEQLLVAILSDQQWWVRYRAAQALMTLGFVNIDGMRRILNSQTDNYARDIIKHVLAEGAMIKDVVTRKTTAAA
jgi:hypothetical protein